MTRLIGVELRRGLARRLNRALFVLAVIAIVVAGVWAFALAQDADGIRREQAAVDQQRAAIIESCLIERGGGRPPATPPLVTDRPFSPSHDGATIDLTRQYCESRANYQTNRPTPPFQITQLWIAGDGATVAPTGTRALRVGDSWLLVPATLLFLLGLVVGSSLVGAETQTGSMTVFLTWEPRRVRVALTKVLAAALLVAAAAFALQALLGVVLVPTAALKGANDGVSGPWFVSLLGAMARISILAGAAAAIGAAIAMIGRRTALALGVAFVWLAVAEPLLGTWQANLRPLLISINTAIVMTGEQLSTERFERAPSTAAITLGVYAAVLLVGAAVVFRRRDVAST